MDQAPTPIDTFGWDTVSAITYTEVNRAIRKSATYPANFARTDGGVSVSGGFDGWALTTGGANGRISLILSLSGAELDQAGTRTAAQPFDLLISVEAGFIPQPGTAIADLALQTGDKPVEITTTANDLEVAGFTYLQATIFITLIGDWLKDNLDLFNHVFASVNIEAMVDAADPTRFQWLKPSWYSYAVSEPISGKTNDNCVFAVLSLIDGRLPPPDLAQQVSHRIIPDGRPAAFALAPDVFLGKFLMPAAAYFFQGVELDLAVEYFELESSGLSFKSTRKLTLKPLQLMHPQRQVNLSIDAGDFSVTVDGSRVNLEIENMGFEWSPGIDVSMKYTADMTVGFTPATGHIELIVDTHRMFPADVQNAKWLKDLNLAVGIVAGMASLLGAVGGGVAVFSEAGEAVAAADGAGGFAAASQNIISALNGGAQATSVADRLVVFAKIAGLVSVAGAALSSPAWVTAILDSIAENEAVDQAGVTALAAAAVQNYATWPETLGTFQMTDAALNGALVFTLDSQTA